MSAGWRCGEPLAVFLVLEVVVGLSPRRSLCCPTPGHVHRRARRRDGPGRDIAARPRERRPAHLRAYRAEVLAALANAVLLFAVAAWVLSRQCGASPIRRPCPGSGDAGRRRRGSSPTWSFALLREGAKEASTCAAPTSRYWPTPSARSASRGRRGGAWAFGWRYADPIVATGSGCRAARPGRSPGRRCGSWSRRAPPMWTSAVAGRAGRRGRRAWTCTTCTSGR